MKKVLFALIGVLSLGSVAVAADMPVYKAPNTARVAPLFSWAGFYMGGGVSYVKGSAEGSISPFGFGPFGTDIDTSGWGYGGHVGSRWALGGNWIAGVELNIDKLSVDGSGTVSNTGGAVTASYSKDWLAYGLVSIGYAMDRWLPSFGVGGACSRGNLTLAAGGGSIKSDDVTACGWAVGVSLDYALMDNLTVGLGYLYADLGSSDPTMKIGALGGVGISAPVSQDLHQVKARASLKW